MPIYDYKCLECGIEKEAITHHSENAVCKCGREMVRLFHARYGINMGPVPTGGYFDDTLGMHIGTNTQRKLEMARQGVSDKGGTPKPQGQAWV